MAESDYTLPQIDVYAEKPPESLPEAPASGRGVSKKLATKATTPVEIYEDVSEEMARPKGRQTITAPANVYEDVSEADAAPKKQKLNIKPWEVGVGAEDRPGLGSAILGGVKSGVTMGGAPLVEGVQAASGMSPTAQTLLPVPAMAVGGYNLAKEALTNYSLADVLNQTDQQATKAYETARDQARAKDQAGFEAHPYGYLGGQLLGSGLAAPAMPFSVPAKVIAAPGASKVAAGIKDIGKKALYGAEVGGTTGAITGFNEGAGTSDSLKGAGVGGIMGLATGAALPVVAKGIGLGLSTPYNQIKQLFPHGAAGLALKEVSESVNEALARNPNRSKMIAEGDLRGQPVANIDLGDADTLRLAKHARNVDPKAHEILDSLLTGRMGVAQQDRMQEQAKNLVTTGANAPATKQALREEYKQTVKPLYEKAYPAGDKPLWSPKLEQLMSSPDVYDAVKGAIRTGKSYSVADGYGGFNPPAEVTADGMLRFHQGAHGMPTYPNLQFWDYASRNLRAMAENAYKHGFSGSGTSSNVLNELSKQLTAELDRLVPEYGVARGKAAQFFKAGDALEAGRKFINMKGDIRDAQKVISDLNPFEKQQFQEGAASELFQKIGAISDDADVVKRLFNTKRYRQQLEMAFGKDLTDKMEAYALVEKTMAEAKRFVIGNSSTAMQGIDWARHATHGAAGFGGFAGLEFLHQLHEGEGVDMGKMLAIGLIGPAGKALLTAGSMNKARAIAELLASNDPTKLQQGILQARKDPLIMQGLRDAPRFFAELTKYALRVQAGHTAAETGNFVRHNQAPEIPAMGGI